MLEAFFVALLFTFISEIADKTQLIILGLALKYKASFQVFIGALIAHSFMDAIAIVVGYFFSFQVQSNLIKIIIGIAFVLLGAYGLMKIYIKKPKPAKIEDFRGPENPKDFLGKEKKMIEGRTPLAVSFLTVLLSEFGDKTQISSGLLAAKYLLPWHVLIGTILALVLAIGLNVFIGAKVAKKLPAKAIKISTNVLFIIFGLISLLN